MAKITIMSGLPASGKSTRSKSLIAERGNTVRINKDLLRTMLHFDVFNYKNEELTRDAAKAIAETFLNRDINVIIDDTNLNPKTVSGWVALAEMTDSHIEYIDMDTTYAECVYRDGGRVGEVGESVILKMALQHKDYLKGEKVVLCDIDGTLADCEHRRHFLDGEKKDWAGFFGEMHKDPLRDDVLKDVLDMCNKENAYLIIVSARPEKYRDVTEKWLDNVFIGTQCGEGRVGLIMRENHDKGDDVITKGQMYDKYFKKLDVVAVFDDRPKVIRMWRDKGLAVVDVGNGEEF